jgi:hypothetical protein
MSIATNRPTAQNQQESPELLKNDTQTGGNIRNISGVFCFEEAECLITMTDLMPPADRAVPFVMAPFERVPVVAG